MKKKTKNKIQAGLFTIALIGIVATLGVVIYNVLIRLSVQQLTKGAVVFIGVVFTYIIYDIIYNILQRKD